MATPSSVGQEAGSNSEVLAPFSILRVSAPHAGICASVSSIQVKYSSTVAVQSVGAGPASEQSTGGCWLWQVFEVCVQAAWICWSVSDWS